MLYSTRDMGSITDLIDTLMVFVIVVIILGVAVFCRGVAMGPCGGPVAVLTI